MSQVSPAELQGAVERLHECKAVLIATEPVIETLGGEAMWEVEVLHFALSGHPTADLVYAWSSPIADDTEHQIFAVLRSVPVQSARDAVRAAIAVGFRRSPPPPSSG